MSNVKCRKIKKKALMNQCGELTCNCKSEMDAFVALMNPDAGEAVASCTIAKKKPTYKLFCDEDSDGTHDAAEASQTFKVKCRNGGIRKNKFDQLLCGNAIIGRKKFFQNFQKKYFRRRRLGSWTGLDGSRLDVRCARFSVYGPPKAQDQKQRSFENRRRSDC